MPVFRFRGEPVYVRAIVMTAADNTDSTGNQHDGSGPTVIVLATFVAILGSTILAYIVYVRVRARSNRVRIVDLEEGNEAESIVLNELAPVEDNARTIYQSRNPEFSTRSLPNRRTLNERTMALSSNPPSQTDLNAAVRGFLSQNNAREKTDSDGAGESTQVASESSQDESSQTPPFVTRPPSRSRLIGSRRHGMLFDSDMDSIINRDFSETHDDQTDLRPASRGLEDIPEVVSQFRRRLVMSTNSEIIPPSTIREETSSDIAEAHEQGDLSIDSNTVDHGSSKDAPNTQDVDREHHDQTDSSRDPNDNAHEVQNIFQDEGTISDDEVVSVMSDDNRDQIKNPGDEDNNTGGQGVSGELASEAEIHEVLERRNFAWSDEAYDPKDPRYDVEGTINTINRSRKGTLREIIEKTTGQSSSSASPEKTAPTDSQFEPMQREFTRASLVPQPLRIPVRRSNTTHDGSSVTEPTATDMTAVGETDNTPAVETDTTDSSDLEDLSEERNIRPPRPRSFVVRGWPPETGDPALRESMWRSPPSTDIIERSRNTQERREWEEKARELVIEKAKSTGEILTDEEVAKRARRMYERSSQFTLEPTIYDPPPQARREPSSRRTSAQVVPPVDDPLAVDENDDSVSQETETASSTQFPRRSSLRQSTQSSVNTETTSATTTQRPPRPAGLYVASGQGAQPIRLEAALGYTHRANSSSLYSTANQPGRPTHPDPAIASASASSQDNRPGDGFYTVVSRDDRIVRPEAAFASSQVLPLAATSTSITAQDGSQAGSPAPSPTPTSSRSQRASRIPRILPDPDLSRYR